MKKKTKKEKIPEYEIEEWRDLLVEKINRLLLKKKKVVVCIAGASASGKGEATEYLLQKLNKEGRKTIIIRTDDFYKGISKMIAERLSKQSFFVEEKQEKIEKIIKKITAKKVFDEKFTEKNIKEILEKTISTKDVNTKEKALSKIKKEIENLNFDSISALNLDLIIEIIKKTKKEKDICVPSYSMLFSEPVSKKKTSTKKYDVILIEGIFALNKKISKEADIKTFVDADRRTLFMRRFRRDVFNKRTSFSPEVALSIILEVVLPAYKKYILPSKENSDLILINNYTENEVFDANSYEVQDKIFLNKKEEKEIEKILGNPEKTNFQKDFYFVNEEEDFNIKHLIRVREEDGLLESLIYKGTKTEREDGKIIRPTEAYIKNGQFSERYKNSYEILSAFHSAGFNLIAEIKKTRKIYKKNGIEIALDRVEELGSYVEIKTNNKLSKSPEIDKIKEELRLAKKKSVGPYIDEYFFKIKNVLINKKEEEHEKDTREKRIFEVMRELTERDFKDFEIDQLNREDLIEKGLEVQKPKKLIIINTGIVKGVENVLDIIKRNIKKDVRIIAIEGKSGTGKSTTTQELKKIIKGQVFSMGEIFRYITFSIEKKKKKDVNKIISGLFYQTINNEIKLFDKRTNITDKLKKELRDKKIEEKLPSIAVLYQKEVIDFSQKQIIKIKDNFNGFIILEGRAFTLDFLPADLRVRLVTEPSIRAERRCSQDF